MIAILTRFVDCCWSVFRWGVFLAVAAALALGGYLYFRLDDEIRRQVEHRLAGHYQHLSVHVGGARFEKDRGISVFDLAVFEPQAGSTPQPLVSADELYLAGRMRMEDLVKGQPPIERIIVRRPRLRAVLHPDGRWNIATLLPLPKFSDQCPVLSIEDATLICDQLGRKHGESLTIRGIHVSLSPIPAASTGVTSHRYQVQGIVTGLPAKELTFEGNLDPLDGSLDLRGSVVDLDVSPELLASVPGISADDMAGAQLSGRVCAGWHVMRNSGPNAVVDWSASAKIDRGQLNHALLPNPITALQATLSATPRALKVEELTGRWGSAEVVMACERRGWKFAAPLGMAVKIAGLPIDERFAATLPGAMARIWKRFEPAGLVDAEVRLAFDGRRWQPHLAVDCRGISLTDAEKFPYPLEQATGKVEYTPATAEAPDKFMLNLTANGGGRPVRIQAELSHLASGLESEPQTNPPSGPRPPLAAAVHPLGFVEISGIDIPLHEQLLAALPDKGRRVVQALRAQGAFDFCWRAEWTDPAQEKADVTQSITLKGCTIQFDKFPYTLHHVQGLITGRNWQWEWQNVEGRGGNDSTIVYCSGRSTPEDDGCNLDLVFQGQNVPLDDNLRQALVPGAQKAWSELRPQGRIDLAAHVVHSPGQTAPLISVRVRPREQSVSIEPQAFPYRLEQLAGEATFQAGRVELNDAVAHHDRATYSAKSAVWQPTPNGGWQFVLTGFNVDRFTPQQRDLLIALPPRLQKILERLQPVGTFEISNSALSFTKAPTLERLASAWDINLTCHQAGLASAFPLDNLSGEIRLIGQDDTQNSYTVGELAIDSVVVKDVQLTNVRGPLWVDRSLCLLGRPATQKQGQPLRRITADAYGGSLAGDVRIEHDGNPRYRLEVALGGADLARFANERLGGPKELSGTVSGKLALAGAGQSTHSLNGEGELHVVDANIYELPVLVSLLKVLKVRTPNSTAFDRCDMQFQIQGEHVHFNQVNLLGDAVSLYGRGETNFDRQLNLVFYSLVGPADLPIPLWKTIAGQVSQQGLQLKVTGTWEKPETEKDVLPSVNQVLQEIQDGMKAGAATMTPITATRSGELPAQR